MVKYYLVKIDEINGGHEEPHEHKHLVKAPSHVKDEVVAELTLLYFFTDDYGDKPSPHWEYEGGYWNEWTCYDRTFCTWVATEIPRADFDVLGKYLYEVSRNEQHIDWDFEIDKLRGLGESEAHTPPRPQP